MPVILKPEALDVWPSAGTTAGHAPTLLGRSLKVLMRAYEVSRAANSVRKGIEELISPI